MQSLYQNIPALSIFLMMLCAIVSVLCPGGRSAGKICIASTVLLIVMSLILFAGVYGSEAVSFTYSMGIVGAPWGNELRAGPLEAALASAFSIVLLCSILGAQRDTRQDISSPRQKYYYLMIQLTMASILVLLYTNDIFTAYVFIELNSISACALVMAKDEGKTIAATIRYLIMSLLGSGLFLMSTALLYGITGHLLMEDIHNSIDSLLAQGQYVLPIAVLLCLMTVGLAIKSALWPFSSWLPDAHGSATTASSAILSGLVLKGYIVLLAKIYIRVFGLENIRLLGINWVILILGACGMIFGSIRAIQESNLKRMVAYSSVAQVGYVFLAMGMGSPAGMASAMYQVLAHAFAKPLIFLCSGQLINAAGHTKQISRLSGAARNSPLAGIGFTLGGFALIGLPLMGSFAAKLSIGYVSLSAGWEAVLILASLGISSVLNALYYLPVMVRIWLPNSDERLEWRQFDGGFIFSQLVLICFMLLLGTAYHQVGELLNTGIPMF